MTDPESRNIMSQLLSLPPGLSYLPLSEEAIPLLKRGVLPLTAPEDSVLPGYLAPAGAAHQQVSREDYLAHLQAEYGRLPATLKSLLTVEAFIQQAESKRADIEAALLRRQEAAAEQQCGSPAEWLWQSFYTDPGCALAWSHSGFRTLWLGIDARLWEGASLSPVQYEERWPLSWPERLLCDAPARAGLAQQRLLCARSAVEKSVLVGGRRQWLLRLPPKALRVVLIGAGMEEPFRRRLQAFLKQDFRYQRIPLAEMQLQPQGMSWQFQLRSLTSSENA